MIEFNFKGVTYSTENDGTTFIHESWEELINNNILLINSIDNHLPDNFTPEPENIFRFLNNDLSNVEYVIIAQDPYPQVINEIHTATGRSFEISGKNCWTEVYFNKALGIIIKLLFYYYINNKVIDSSVKKKEIVEKLSSKGFRSPNVMFDYLEQSGFLFLNTSLTCKQGKATENANSHTSNWEEFSKNLFKYIYDKNHNVKFISFGDYAKDYLSTFHCKQIEFKHPNCYGNLKKDFFKDGFNQMDNCKTLESLLFTNK